MDLEGHFGEFRGRKHIQIGVVCRSSERSIALSALEMTLSDFGISAHFGASGRSDWRRVSLI